jgi:hypothetical protein
VAAPAGSLASATAAASPAASPGTAPLADAAAAQGAPHPLLYRSPVGRRVVSFKFAAVPGGKGMRTTCLNHTMLHAMH